MYKFLPCAALGAEGVSASTGYVLVDLSATDSYPHAQANYLLIHRVRLHGEKASDGVYDIWLGVVTRVDATNGDVTWIHRFDLEAVGNPTDSTDRFAQEICFAPLNLEVSSGALTQFVSNQTTANSTVWQTDTGLASPLGAAGGATGKPGVGDLVVYVEEVSGTGTIDFHIGVDYEAA